jgi:parallel beta-helix repeat protein
MCAGAVSAQHPSTAALYVSTHGDDRSDGLSPERALRTISEAMSRARPGVTVYLEEGRYSEQLVTRRGGAPGAAITVTSLNGPAIIDGSALRRADRDQNEALVELRHPFVRLVGLDIANSRNTGILLAANDLTVENCIVSNTELHGISTDTDLQTNNNSATGEMISRAVLKNNVIERAALSGRGQAVSLIADGFILSGNTVRDSPKEGIDVWLGARHGEIAGNNVYGNDAPGIYIDGASDIRIHDNRVYWNRSGIGVSSEDVHYATHGIWVFNNLVYDNSETGCFLWDDERRPGHKGVQDVVIAYNTFVGNKNSLYLAGENDTADIFNNLGYSTDDSVVNRASRSSVYARGNVWLSKVMGFVAPRKGDFRLTAKSPAIGKGVAIQQPVDPSVSMAADFAGRPRNSGRPDAGAFEYVPGGTAQSEGSTGDGERILELN